MQRPRFLFCRCFFRVRLLVYFIFFSFLFYVSFHKHTRNHFMKSGNEKGIQFFRALVQINLRDVISMVKKKKSAFSIGIVWHEIKKKKNQLTSFSFTIVFFFFFFYYTPDRHDEYTFVSFLLTQFFIRHWIKKKNFIDTYYLYWYISLTQSIYIDLYAIVYRSS